MLDHLAVAHDLAPADVEALAVESTRPADGGEVGDDIVERDRLGGRGDPARADHRGQAVDEREDRLERGAAGADDHGGAQRRHRSGARRECAAGLEAAAQVRREVGGVVPEASQVDDLPQARCRRRAGNRLGRDAVALLEVGGSERVDEVVGDVRSCQRRPHRLGIGRFRPHPGDAAVVRPFAARDCDDVVVARERAHQRRSDRAGRSEDDDSHPGS